MSPGPADATATGARVAVERLSLQIAGLDEDAARGLARRVAEGLAPALSRVSAGTGLDHLRVVVNGAPPAGAAGGPVDHLASQIIDQVQRALTREPVARPLGDGGVL